MFSEEIAMDRLSNDAGRSDVGVMVIEKTFTF